MDFFYVLLPFLSFVAGWEFNGQKLEYLVLSMLLLLLWAGVLLWRRIGEGLRLPRGKFVGFMFAFVVWLGLTLIWTTVPYTSWFYFWILGSLPLAFLLWQFSPESDEVWPQLWTLLLFSAAALSLWGIYQFTVNMLAHHYYYRPMGPLLDYNSYAALLNLLFFPIFTRYLLLPETGAGEGASKRRWIQVGYLVTLGLVLFAAATAVSRGGTLAWLLLLPFALWNVRKRPKFGVKTGAVLLMAVLSFAFVNSISSTSVTERFAPNFVEKDRSVGSRFLMWHSAFQIYESHPLLGTGLGSYFIYYPAYRNANELESAGTYAHNDYLEFLQEGGPLTAAFLIGFVLAVMWMAYRLLRERRDPPGMEAAGLYIGVICISAHAFVNFIYFNQPIAMLAGLLAGRAYQLTHPGELGRPLLQRLRVRAWLARTAMILLLALPAALLAMDGAIAIAFGGPNPVMQSLARLTGRSEELLRYQIGKLAVTLRPLASGPHTYMAIQKSKLLDQDLGRENRIKPFLAKQILSDYQKALLGNPRQPGVLSGEARFLLQHASYFQPGKAAAEAERLLRQALIYNPQFLDARLNLSQLYFNMGKPTQGYDLLLDGLHRPLFKGDRFRLRMVIAEVAYQLGRKEDALRQLQHLQREYPDNPQVNALMKKVVGAGG